VVFCVGKPAKLWQKSDPDWAPTLLMGHETRAIKHASSTTAVLRNERRANGDLQKSEAEQVAKILVQLSTASTRHSQTENSITDQQQVILADNAEDVPSENETVALQKNLMLLIKGFNNCKQ
jgi:hypothetical protein